ncbi:hypothetical protein ACET3Z_020539 [Daucus carota]
MNSLGPPPMTASGRVGAKLMVILVRSRARMGTSHGKWGTAISAILAGPDNMGNYIHRTCTNIYGSFSFNDPSLVNQPLLHSWNIAILRDDLFELRHSGSHTRSDTKLGAVGTADVDGDGVVSCGGAEGKRLKDKGRNI